MSRPKRADVEVGTVVPEQTFTLQRVDLIRYAGASGDFNEIHWNPVFATSVGLPGTIAHGMLTMATALRVVTDWAGDPGAVVEYGVRFTRPVPVADGPGTEVIVAGVVKEFDENDNPVITLTATSGGQTVLAKARVVVRLA